MDVPIPPALHEEALALCAGCRPAAAALAACALYYATTPREVLAHGRVLADLHGRVLFMYVLHAEGYTAVEIARLSGRDHSTVLHDLGCAARDLAAHVDGLQECLLWAQRALDESQPPDDGGLIHAAAAYAGVEVALLSGAIPDSKAKRALRPVQRLLFWELQQHGYTPRRAAALLSLPDAWWRTFITQRSRDLRCPTSAALLADLHAHAPSCPRLGVSGAVCASPPSVLSPAPGMGAAPRRAALDAPGALFAPGCYKRQDARPTPHDAPAYAAYFEKRNRLRRRDHWRYDWSTDEQQAL